MKTRRLWAFFSIAFSAGALAATDSPHMNTVPPNAAGAGGLYPIYRPKPFYPNGAVLSGYQGCVRLAFSVGSDGKPKDIRVWSDYHDEKYQQVAGMFDQAAINTVSRWRFHPRVLNGRAVSTRGVFQTIVFLFGGAEGGPQEAAERATLTWFCRQPPMHGVAIFARNSQAPPSATSAGASAGGINPVVYLTPSFAQGAAPGRVKIRFCIGPEGRVRDTMLRDSSPGGIYDEAARRALERVDFSARKVDGKPVWTCGLTVPVSFSGALGGKLGQIGALSYERLSGRPAEPVLKEEKPVKLSLSIPSGTKLPPVAKVELHFCIEKDGSVSDVTVVHADPPRLFDRAAIETVENWRFGRIPARMCDVYEGVRFPLGGG